MRFRSKPTVIEAIEWTGSNYADTFRFVRGDESPYPVVGQMPLYRDPSTGTLYLLAGKDGESNYVPVPLHHWIARTEGDLSDHWPLNPDHLSRKYEPIGDDDE